MVFPGIVVDHGNVMGSWYLSIALLLARHTLGRGALWFPLSIVILVVCSSLKTKA